MLLVKHISVGRCSYGRQVLASRVHVPFVQHRQLRRQQHGTKPRNVVQLAAAESEAVVQPSAEHAETAPAPANNILYVVNLGSHEDRAALQAALTERFKPCAGFQRVQLLGIAGKPGRYTAYAVFDSDDAALAARKALRGTNLGGRKISVGTHKRIGDKNAAPDSKSSSSSGAAQQQQRTKQQQQQRNAAHQLYVGNLAWGTMAEDLQEHFKQCNGYKDAFITYDKKGRPSGFGFVRFDSAENADAAVKAMDQTELDGRVITVQKARPGRIESSTTDSSSTDAPTGQNKNNNKNNSRSSTGSAKQQQQQQQQRKSSALQGATETETRVVLSQLPTTYTWKEVFGMCSVFGEVRKVIVYSKTVAGAAAADEGRAVAGSGEAFEDEQTEQSFVLQDGDAAEEEAAVDDDEDSSSGGGGVKQQQQGKGGRVPAAIAFMVDRQGAERVAVELDGKVIQGCRLRVNLYKTKPAATA